MRLIDKDALIKALGIDEDCDNCEKCVNHIGCANSSDFVDACEAICDAPIIDPVRHGKWEDEKYTRRCSECGSRHWKRGENAWHYCPECGAKMEE